MGGEVVELLGSPLPGVMAGGRKQLGFSNLNIIEIFIIILNIIIIPNVL